MKLYEYPPTRSIRVRWTLQELGVPFESVVVDIAKGEHKQAAFLKVNPAGKLPALVDGDQVLTESVAIVLYLAEKYSDRGLLPRELGARAQCYRWLLFAATELEQPVWRIAKHTAIYPKDKRIAADVALAREEFEAMAAVLDEHMRGRKFVATDAVTVADFVTAYALDMASVAGLLDRFAELRRYVGEMYARPKAAMRIKQAFAKLKEGKERSARPVARAARNRAKAPRSSQR
jgi:glutathione S-transferase